MKIEEIYLKFLQKVNRNLRNDNISVDRGRFVFLINEAMLRRCEYLLDKKNEDDIRMLQRLVTYEHELKDVKKSGGVQSYKLPVDFMDFINTRVSASNSKCSKQPLQVWEAKLEDVDELMYDDFNKPSFDYRETFYTIGDDNINYYVTDFSIDKVFISYYRYPRKVDISGYIKSDGSMSVSIDPEMDDIFMERVIDSAAATFAANSENYQKFQTEFGRTMNKL